MFCNFCKKFENSKWPPCLARQNFFENWNGYSAKIPCGSKISSKSLYLARFSRLQFCEKFENSKWPPLFLEKIFLKKLAWLLCRDTLWVKNFVEISIEQGFRDISIFIFCNFCEKFENSKWPPFLVRPIFF